MNDGGDLVDSSNRLCPIVFCCFMENFVNAVEEHLVISDFLVCISKAVQELGKFAGNEVFMLNKDDMGKELVEIDNCACCSF